MAYSSNEKIEIIEKEILEKTRLVNSLYKKLGENVAFYVNDKSFQYCIEELSNYEISRNEYNKLLKRKNNLKSKVEEIAECRSDVFKLRDALIEKKEEEKKELSRFGAAIYEAYSNKQLEDSLIERLDVIFDNINQKLDNAAKKRDTTNIILLSAMHDKKINTLQKSLINLFIKSAQYILDENLQDKLCLKNKDKYLKNLYEVIKKRKSLEKNIISCEERIEKIKKEDELSPDRKLEELKSELKILDDAQIEAAILLGKELYNILPDDITSIEIGVRAIAIIDEITIELAKIESLEQDIEKLNNEIFISQLSAQIAHERSKINQLQNEIKNCYSQIDKIEVIINKKRDKIIELKNAGTYEKSDVKPKILDE